MAGPPEQKNQKPAKKNGGAVGGAVARVAPANRQQQQQAQGIININGQQVHAQMQYAMQQVTTPAAKVVVHASFIIDASYSMTWPAGNGRRRMDVLLQYVEQTIRTVLCPTDRVTLAFFNSKYHQVWHKTQVKTFLTDRFQRMRATAEEMLNSEGGTALWDSTIKALSSMQKTETDDKGKKIKKDHNGNTILRFMVVFTDGEDNKSSSTMQQAAAQVANPGFGKLHFVGLAVGAPREAVRMQDAFKLVKGATIIAEADCDAKAIHAAFGRADKAMRQAKKALVEKITLTLVNNNKGAQPCAPQVLQAVGMGKPLGKPQTPLALEAPKLRKKM